MALFLLSGSYTAEGTKGVLKDGGSARRAAVQKLVQQVGGKIEAFYFGLGDADVYVIADLPDKKAAVAVSLAVNASGAIRLKTTPLMTVEDMDAAAKTRVTYQAPGA